MDESSSNLKDGLRVEILSSWQEFPQKARSLKAKRGYVWRGQKRDWPLLPSFDRKVHSEDQGDRDRKLKHHLDNFREVMSKLYPDVLPRDEDDVWALGQHYGLKTPLLDWTASPHIAAYFAFDEGVGQDDQSDCYRYVYALNRSVERLRTKQKKGSEVLSSDQSVPFIDQLPYPNPRFAAQRGVFTKALQGNDVWKYVQTFARKRPGQVLIVEFRIPTKDRQDCLRDLHLMNIDHTSLLLDLHDAVDHCKSKL